MSEAPLMDLQHSRDLGAARAPWRQALAMGALCLALGLGLVAMAKGAQAQGAGPSIFESLEAQDAALRQTEEQANGLGRDLEEMSAQLEARREEMDRAYRSTMAVRREVTGRMAAWERAWREAGHMVLHGAPGEAEDTMALLRQTQRTALMGSAERFALLRRLGDAERATDALFAELGREYVLFAQYRAEAATARLRHQQSLAGLDDPAVRPDILAALARTDEALAETLPQLPPNPVERDFHRLKGTLALPVEGRITQGFAPRRQAYAASFVRHSGLTFAAAPGTSVKAAAEGMVALAERFEGFGNLVVLDHGAGYHSVYAHLEAFAVEVGQELGRGEPVGLSGATGSLEGPCLYFELRKEGRPIDPAPWFQR